MDMSENPLKDEGLQLIVEFTQRVFNMECKVILLQKVELTVAGALKLSHAFQPKLQHPLA